MVKIVNFVFYIFITIRKKKSTSFPPPWELAPVHFLTTLYLDPAAPALLTLFGSSDSTRSVLPLGFCTSYSLCLELCSLPASVLSLSLQLSYCLLREALLDFQFEVTFCSTIYITMCDPCGKLSGSETEGMGTREEGTTASQLEEGWLSLQWQPPSGKLDQCSL